MYGYRTVGDPQCLWSFVVKDAVLSLTTEVEEGKVCGCVGVCMDTRVCADICVQVACQVEIVVG